MPPHTGSPSDLTHVLPVQRASSLPSRVADALVLGLNCVSDGLHVVLPAAAAGLSAQLAAAGYLPVPVDLSELLKAGGSVKCCTLELR